MNLDDNLTPGWHTITMTVRGSILVDERDKITVAEAIDDIQATGSLSDWTVDGD